MPKVNDAPLVGAKELAPATPTRLVADGLQPRTRALQAATTTVAGTVPMFHGRGGPLPGVNPNSNKSMLDAADDAP